MVGDPGYWQAFTKLRDERRKSIAETYWPNHDGNKMDRTTIIHNLRATAEMLEKTIREVRPDNDSALAALVYKAAKNSHALKAQANREAADILERLN